MKAPVNTNLMFSGPLPPCTHLVYQILLIRLSLSIEEKRKQYSYLVTPFVSIANIPNQRNLGDKRLISHESLRIFSLICWRGLKRKKMRN